MSFPIFIENKGLTIPIEKKIFFSSFVIYFICFFSIVIIKNDFFDKNLVYVFFALILFVGVVSAINSFRFDKLHGEIKGTLIFETQVIRIDDKVIPLSDIDKLHIIYDDYFKKKRVFEKNGLDFHKRGYSMGVENYAEILLKDKQKIIVYFQQLKKDHMLDFKDILIHYYKLQIISWIHLLEILKIEDYGEIQKFKSDIKELK